MARFQVIAVAILVIFMLLSIGMSTALPKPIQGRKLFQYNPYPTMRVPTSKRRKLFQYDFGGGSYAPMGPTGPYRPGQNP
ncbi:hypothetical protein SADUNF_Sadunf16G0098300 [Salix dunnii]|uniref:Glycine-rich protein n=1 Tax=Salix dunnii TaxID=1413687 RepID=A0A835J5Z4_9ROSI|nr:hypothetical protein SADUNF_Sadunf16G0098300 [Salix dunnii]